MQKCESANVRKHDRSNIKVRENSVLSFFKEINMQKSLLSLFFSFMLLLFLTVFTGCDKDESPTTPETTSPDLIYQGWDLFEGLEYQLALDTFLEAIELDVELTDDVKMDAYNGAGWSCGKLLGRLDDAKEYFELSEINGSILLDALGGKIFVEYLSGKWETAILLSDSLLVIRPSWHFFHENTLDFHDIRLIIARSYFNLGNFDSSLETVNLYFNSSFETDISTPLGRRALLEELERLSEIYG